MLIAFELVFKESSHTHSHRHSHTHAYTNTHAYTHTSTHSHLYTQIHTQRETHTQSALQCFFITNQPQEIINEGLGGYTAAKPRRMSEQRENYLLRREQVMLRRMASWKGIPSQSESFYTAQSQHAMSQNA